MDTIKLIAYRAGTALVRVAREKLQGEDEAWALVRQIFGTAVDLQPEVEAKTQIVRLYCLSTEAHHAVQEHVCGELNATETTFPWHGPAPGFRPGLDHRNSTRSGSMALDVTI